MIINTSQGDVEVIGDVKEFKTSIDPKNLEFITTLLSSNLYSNPEQSFIREIVSNAWDSHVEADNTKEPVIIRFKNKGFAHSITIRDYGTGLSPERFQTIFCNIGSSTKRDSNNFIGGFGIGRFSALACSNSVNIISYYKGTAYYYIMVKSGNHITTNLLMEKPTTEKNGVEITIGNIRNIQPYYKALNYIVFFPNIYIEGVPTLYDDINSSKIKRFKNFAASSIRIDSKLLLGNVLYPINPMHLSSDNKSFIINGLSNTGIVISFNIGEISVTPNRESIIYDSKTIKLINDRIEAAKEELHSLIRTALSKDYDDIKLYSEVVCKAFFYDPITNHLHNNTAYGISRYRVCIATGFPANVTLKGHNLAKYWREFNMINNLRLPRFKGIIEQDKIYTSKIPNRLLGKNHLDSSKIIIIDQGTRLVEVIKAYLRENYDGYSIITDITLAEFQKYVKETLSLANYYSYHNIIIDETYKSIMNRAVRIDFNTDQEFLKFKADYISSKDKSDIPSYETILYIHRTEYWREKRTFTTFSNAVQWIKDQRKGIILVDMKTDTAILYKIADLKGYVLVQAKKSTVEDLKKVCPKYFVDIDWLLHKDPLLSKVKAITSVFPENFPQVVVLEICKQISEGALYEIMDVVKLYNKAILGNSFYVNLANSDSIIPDPYTLYVCSRLATYIDAHIKAHSLLDGVSDSTILTTAALVKTKAYKVNNRAYQNMRNNKFLRILCKK